MGEKETKSADKRFKFFVFSSLIGWFLIGIKMYPVVASMVHSLVEGFGFLELVSSIFLYVISGFLSLFYVYEIFELSKDWDMLKKYGGN